MRLPLLPNRRTRARLSDQLTDIAFFIRDPQRSIGVDRATRRVLLGAVIPLWMGAGLFDYICHRRTKIEQTSGTHESAIHALMMTEAGIPVMLGLFFDVNALSLLVMGGSFIAHEITALWDVAYAETKRQVTPNEQHAHSFLEVVPLMAVATMVSLHWDQALALLGRGPDSRPDFHLRLKRPMLPPRATIAILAAVFAGIVVPYAEELIRCYRQDHTFLAHDVPHQESPLAALESYAGVMIAEEQPRPIDLPQDTTIQDMR